MTAKINVLAPMKIPKSVSLSVLLNAGKIGKEKIYIGVDVEEFDLKMTEWVSVGKLNLHIEEKPELLM